MVHSTTAATKKIDPTMMGHISGGSPSGGNKLVSLNSPGTMVRSEAFHWERAGTLSSSSYSLVVVAFPDLVVLVVEVVLVLAAVTFVVLVLAAVACVLVVFDFAAELVVVEELEVEAGGFALCVSLVVDVDAVLVVCEDDEESSAFTAYGLTSLVVELLLDLSSFVVEVTESSSSSVE